MRWIWLFWVSFAWTDQNLKQWGFGDAKISKLPFLEQKGYFRVKPVLDGIPTLGLDRLIEQTPEGFGLDETPEPIEVITQFQKTLQQVLHETRLEPYEPGAHPVWMHYLGHTRATYQIPVTKGDIHQWEYVWVDAQEGRVIRKEPLVRFLDATENLFETPPDAQKNLVEQTKPLILKYLKTNQPGDVLSGLYFQTFNCCKYYVCKNGGNQCALKDRICAPEEDPLKFPHALVSSFDKNQFPNLVEYRIPNPVYFFSFQCLKGTNAYLGQNYAPVDDRTAASEEEPFALLQAYYGVNQFFDYIRSRLQDSSWCLRNPCGMQCDGLGNLKSGTSPFPVHVNQLIPKTIEEDGTVFEQLTQRKRGSSQNPVLIRGASRVDNAAFIPCILKDPQKQNPEDILNGFIKPYDQLFLFQGRRDTSYDHSVVFHELMHAVTQTFVPDLYVFGGDRYGIYAEPGALHEAWSDYFAASALNSPQIGLYGASHIQGDNEVELRNLSESRRCPDNIIGEVHEDSQVFTNALWELRNFVQKDSGKEGVARLDQYLLLALSRSESAETFAKQSSRIVQILNENPTWQQEAKTLFEKNNLLSCDKIHYLEPQTKRHMILMDKEGFGLSNYTPPPVQLAIPIERGSQGVSMTFQAFYAQGTLPKENPFRFIIENEPVMWAYDQDQARAFVEKTEAKPSDLKAVIKDKIWTLEYKTTPDCEEKIIYISVLNQGPEVLIKDLQFTPGPVTERCPGAFGCACSAQTPSPLVPVEWVLLLIGLWAWSHYRRKKLL